MASGADIQKLSIILKKPLRVLWEQAHETQSYWDDDLPDYKCQLLFSIVHSISF
jgi:hypothetical protein